MMLAFSTNAFTRFPLPAALEGIAAAGFSGVEVLADVPHAYPPTLTPTDRDQLIAALARLKLTVTNVNANCTFGYWRHAPPEPYFEPSLISPIERYRQDRIEMIGQTLQLARDIGARNISITTGRCLAEISPAIAAGRLVESLKPLLDAADRLNIDVGIELEPGLYLETAIELRELIGRLNHPRLGANLDIGHSVVNGERIDESVQTLAGRIWNLHVEDLPGIKHYHQIPGDGNFDWQQLRRVLQSIGYDRGVTVELYTQSADPHTAARRSYAFLNALLL
ncbi:MAG TPA: sugar phosphate isomerase/epimerase [Tepidisphaeraceae bacterium]